MTQRCESDIYSIVSGIFNKKTTGAPICAIIYNEDKNSKDYDKLKFIPRPGHADYPAYVKYDGYNDHRGGGSFSGRLTAPIVFAGALCKKLLEEKYGIFIGSHIKSIYNIEDENLSIDNLNEDTFIKLSKLDFPTISTAKVEHMKKAIESAKIDDDSVGGTVEAFVLNMPVGVGEPMFDSIESKIAHMMFSIPSVKGIEFGEGFKLSGMKGSIANDSYRIVNEKIITETNNNGGVLGGLTTGMPIVFRVCIKPTSSIGKVQNSVDLSQKSNTTLKIEGRHDPCIVQRAVPVIECATAIVLLDSIMNNN